MDTMCLPLDPQSRNMGPCELKSLEVNSKLVLEVFGGIWGPSEILGGP